jgi:hypothetical protein
MWNAILGSWASSLDALRSTGLYWLGVAQYNRDFMLPFLLAADSFFEEERKRFLEKPLTDNLQDYRELLLLNLLLAQEAWKSSHQTAVDYHFEEAQRIAEWIKSLMPGNIGKDSERYWADKAKALRTMVADFPREIREVESEYGFHFDTPGYKRIAKTPRMYLYQVLPTEPGVEVRNEVKPVLIAHPYVLGPNIMAFLPGERRSYVHAFANQGIPTYVRIIRDIDRNPAVQLMTGDDDVLDTRLFCRIMKHRHEKPVTLNGICQGGFIALAGLLTGKLDGLVDALITCASPMDGTRSESLAQYLDRIPPRFRTLAYSAKKLPNGNQVIDGKVMSWVYKLRSIEAEAPLVNLYRDLRHFDAKVRNGTGSAGKTAAAVNRWLAYDQTDLPVAITELSKLSYTVPISEKGNLPFTFFGRALNLKHLNDSGIRVQICYGAKDRLVDPPCALAPLDFVDAEIAEFPKGHAAILTSWSHPDSEYALHKRFTNGQKGPVRFHLDLDEDLP